MLIAAQAAASGYFGGLIYLKSAASERCKSLKGTICTMPAQFRYHYAAEAVVATDSHSLFEHLDDPTRLSAHMNRSSRQTAGMCMAIETDGGRGRTVGSHIRMSGRILGIKLVLDEVVTVRIPPARKMWEIVGTPRLLIIGRYQMGFEVKPHSDGTHLRVFIDYARPDGMITNLLGYLFGGYYAKWCTQQMLKDAVAAFAKPVAGPTRSAPLSTAS